MKPPSIEFLPQLNSLLIKLEGKVIPCEFNEIYDQVLGHPDFKPDVNLIWNAVDASINEIKLTDLKCVFDHVKRSERLRGRSYSAWVFARDENYETACLFKAAFGSQLAINYEAFANLSEAKDWIQNVVTRGLGRPPII